MLQVILDMREGGSTLKKLVEERLATLKEKQGVIEENSGLSIADQLLEEILLAYSKNPDIKSLTK
ncbi:MAG TPA: hypothetical protein VFU82_08655 [Gammaproteobacteria bacterium]|nr:hypothetical protein [Gammaproteobacteria bacterium]